MNKALVGGGAALTAACVIWGGLYVVSKSVMNVIPPLALVWVRFALSALVMAPVALARREKIGRADFGWLLLSSWPAFTLSIVTQFAGTALSSAALGSLVTASAPAFIVLLAPPILRERIRWPQVAALAVACAGVAMTVGLPQTAGPRVFLGGLYLTAAGFTWALYTVLNKRLSTRLSVYTITFYNFLLGSLVLTPFAAATALRLPWASFSPVFWSGILYTGLLSTVGAMFLWNWGFARLPAATASLFFFLQPLSGTVLSHLFLGEAVTARLFAGGALILAGVCGAGFNRPGNGKRPPLSRSGPANENF